MARGTLPSGVGYWRVSCILGETPVEDCTSKPPVLVGDSQNLLFIQALFPILLLCFKDLYNSPLLCSFYSLLSRLHLLFCFQKTENLSWILGRGEQR